MKKLKVYLDTSVISHLIQEDVPEKKADTRQLWEMFRTGRYDVYLSTVTLEEIDDCPEPKRGQLYDYLKHYQTKDMTPQERMDYYNSRGLEVHRRIQEQKLQKV